MARRARSGARSGRAAPALGVCVLKGLMGESGGMFDRFVAYLDSIRARDPAPRSRAEILLYPGVWALVFHRAAHWLFEGELYFLARLINHVARWLTAIDIHPGAKI